MESTDSIDSIPSIISIHSISSKPSASRAPAARHSPQDTLQRHSVGGLEQRMVAGLEEITEGELRIDDKVMNDVAP